MIFDGLLAAAGDDEDLIAARGHGLFDAVLNDGLVDQREHFLGLGFGGGQEAGAEAGGGENGFADFHVHGGRDSCRRWPESTSVAGIIVNRERLVDVGG